MKASLIAPGRSAGDEDPDGLSTETNTMLPGRLELRRRPCGRRDIGLHEVDPDRQRGSAPVWPAPSGFFWSKPTQTPMVMSGSKPMNQASV